MANNVLNLTYGKKDVAACGPMVRDVKREGKTYRLSYDHAEGGLICKGAALKGVALAGADGIFTWADARIDGDTVVVSSPAIPDPKALRYAWADNPECNLYNKAGLPASPFEMPTPVAKSAGQK